jgi:polygalacturonase
MKISLKNNSVVEDLYILNTPTHAVDIDGVYDSLIQRITVNNSLGDAPNSISGGLSAAHNTDGFDVGQVYNFILKDCTVYGQDDCVALSESNNVTISGMYCEGTHGLSIAGGGSNGPVIANVL